jgi:hypothetical protein
MMNAVPIDRAETHDVLRSEGSVRSDRTRPAPLSVDDGSLTRNETEQQYVGSERDEEILAEQERPQSRSLSATETRSQEKDTAEREHLRERDPELESVNESCSDGLVKGGARSSRTGSFASRETRSSDYERQIRALGSRNTRASFSSKSRNSDVQSSADNASASIAAASLPRSHARSSFGSTPSSRGKQSSRGMPSPNPTASYLNGTIIISNNNVSPHQKQSTRHKTTSPHSFIKKLGTIVASNIKTTSTLVSSGHNPPAPSASSSRDRKRTIDYPTMSRERQILPHTLPSPTSPIHKSGTITLSDSALSKARYTNSGAQTDSRPTSMTLNEVKRLEDIFGITISVTEQKSRFAELGGHWHGNRLLKVASIVVIAFLMGLMEAWLVGVWYSNIYGML